MYDAIYVTISISAFLMSQRNACPFRFLVRNRLTDLITNKTFSSIKNNAKSGENTKKNNKWNKWDKRFRFSWNCYNLQRISGKIRIDHHSSFIPYAMFSIPWQNVRSDALVPVLVVMFVVQPAMQLCHSSMCRCVANGRCERDPIPNGPGHNTRRHTCVDGNTERRIEIYFKSHNEFHKVK